MTLENQSKYLYLDTTTFVIGYLKQNSMFLLCLSLPFFLGFILFHYLQLSLSFCIHMLSDLIHFLTEYPLTCTYN